MLQQLQRPPVVTSYSSPTLRVYGSPNFLERKQPTYKSGTRPSLVTGATQDHDAESDCGKCYPKRTLQTDPGRRKQSGHKADHKVVSGTYSVHGQLITGMAPQLVTHKARRDEMVAGSAKLPISRALSAMPHKPHSSMSKRLPMVSQGATALKEKTVVESLGVLTKRSDLIDMSTFDNRLESFRYPPRWDLCLPDIDPFILSSHGFWYVGQEDIVRCYACMVELCDWESGHDVFARHFNASPNCPHLRQQNKQCIIDLCKSQFISYRNFPSRLDSFHFARWPLKGIVSPEELAKAGFFYLGKGGKTQCFSCGVVNEKWEAGVSALSVHEKLYSKCPFLLEMVSRVSPSRLLTPPSSPRRKLSQPDKPALSPDYSSLEARLQSFKHYPADAVVEKEDFADAGFYLLQLPSTVRCFACGLTESSWHHGDNPHKRHGQKSEDCPFLKGEPTVPPVTHSSTLPEPAFTVEQLSKWFRVPSVSEEPSPADHENSSYVYPSSRVESLKGDTSAGPSSMSELSSVTNKRETGDVRRRASVHGFPKPSEADPAAPGSDEEVQPGTPGHKEETSILNKPVYYPPSYHRQKKDNPMGTNNKRTRNSPPQTPFIPITTTTNVTTTTTVQSLGYSDTEEKLCVICFEHPKEYALLPCGHLCSCRFCVSKLDRYCPVCRELVTGKARIFLT